MIILRKQRNYSIFSKLFKSTADRYRDKFEKAGVENVPESFYKFLTYYDKEILSDLDGVEMSMESMIPDIEFDTKSIPGKIVLYYEYTNLVKVDNTLYYDLRKKEWGTGKYTSKDFPKILKIYFGQIYDQAKKDYKLDPTDPNFELRYEYVGNILGWIGKNIK